jgi:hypothetical protein
VLSLFDIGGILLIIAAVLSIPVFFGFFGISFRECSHAVILFDIE